MKTLPILSLMLVACGGSHVIGKDRCIPGSCAQTETCDFDGTCRSMCGPNYPNGVCPSGTLCAGWICRTACDPGACPTGSSCAQTQTPNGVASVCGPVLCRDASVCQAGEACIRGLCTATGYACGADQSCGSADVYCDNGICRARCGSNYPSITCATGTTCSQSALCL